MIRPATSAMRAAAAAALALLAGCAVPPARPPPAVSVPIKPTDRFVALDPAAKAAVACSASETRTLADGRLDVLANLENRLAAPDSIRVQCRFWDAGGAPDGEPSAWETVALEAGSTETVHFTAADPKAASCTLVVASKPRG